MSYVIHKCDAFIVTDKILKNYNMSMINVMDVIEEFTLFALENAITK